MASTDMQSWKLPGSLMKNIVLDIKDPPRDENRTGQSRPGPAWPVPRNLPVPVSSAQYCALAAGQGSGVGAAAQLGPLGWLDGCTWAGRDWQLYVRLSGETCASSSVGVAAVCEPTEHETANPVNTTL